VPAAVVIALIVLAREFGGSRRAELIAAATHFRGCHLEARIHTGVDNDEDGEDVAVCRAPRRPWALEWPSLRFLG
jgi:hypothetical protein